MNKTILLDDKQLRISVDRLACQLTENHNDFKDTVLVGLQPRGKELCDIIVNILKDKYDFSNISSYFPNDEFIFIDNAKNKNPIEDLYLMSMAKNFIVTPSSFNW